MTKFLGYYCGKFPKEDGLLADMVESWGGTFEKLNNAQRLWILKNTAENLFNKDPNSEKDLPNDDEVMDALDRLDELSDGEKLGLVEALIAQLKHYS